MRSRPGLLPPPGNPARRFLILLSIMLGVMLVGSAVLMLFSGDDAGTVVESMLIVVVTAIVALGAAWAVAMMFQSDYELLLNRYELVAEWVLSPEEYRAFLADERRRTRSWVVMFISVGAVLGVLGAPFDLTFGIVMVVVFVGIALMVRYLERLPPEAESEAGRTVLVGWGGAQVLGRYRPFDAPTLRLMRIELEHGFPTVLRFRLLERHRPREVRVPVPHDRVADAETVIQRFHDAGLLHGPAARRSLPPIA